MSDQNNLANQVQHRRSLLDFQQLLNDQFDSISLNTTKDSLDFDLGSIEQAQDSLGISFSYHLNSFDCDVRIFLSLSSLKHIISNAKYESIYLTKPWLRGFTHFRGDSYSVIDPMTLFNNTQSFTQVDIESRIILFKEIDNLRFSFLARDILLMNLDLQYMTLCMGNQDSFNKSLGISYSFNPSDAKNQLHSVFADSKLASALKQINPTILSSISAQTSGNTENIVVCPADFKNSNSQHLTISHLNKYAKLYQHIFSNIKEINTQQNFIANVDPSDQIGQKNEIFNTQSLNLLFFTSAICLDAYGSMCFVVNDELLTKYLGICDAFKK